MGKGQDGCNENFSMASAIGLGSEPEVAATEAQLKGPHWLHEAIFMYTQDGLSLREIAERFEVSKTTVRKWLKSRGVPMRNPAKISPIHQSIDIPKDLQEEAESVLSKGLDDIQQKLEALGIPGSISVDSLRSYGTQRVRSGMHYAIYSDAAQFLTKDFARKFSEGLADRHISDGAVVSMLAFERLLADTLSAVGCEGKLSPNSNHPGSDLSYRLYGETWRSSCKSESHKKVAENNDSLQISYLMTWEPPPETAGKKIAHHVEDYDYIHHLRAVQNTTFPDGSSNAGSPACRYNFYQVPKQILEDISKHKLSQGTNTLTLHSRKNPGSTFTVKIELTSGGNVRVPHIPLSEVDLLASFWTSPPSQEET